MTSALFAFLHHAAAFMVVAAVFTELVLMRAPLTANSAQSLARIDAMYGASALLLLGVGLVRVFYTEKGADYYFGNGPFLLKLSLFIAVGLLSIYPTMRFLRWRKALRQGQEPIVDEDTRRRMRMIIHLELVALFVIMLCAALMARGIGFIR